MKKLLIILLLSLLALLAACTLPGLGTPPLTRGYVYDKQYTQGHYHYDPGYTTTTCRKGTCTTHWHSGFSYWVSAQYELEITSCSSLQTDGQCQTGWVYVGEGSYDSYRVGSYYGGN